MLNSPDVTNFLAVIQSGLAPTTDRRKKVAIVGAGMAGLVAAYELQRAGHDPFILEAQQRVGGRIYTMREPFTAGLYAEAGAMRIPRAHKLTMAYIDHFRLAVSPFTMNNPEAFFHLHGRRFRISDCEADPACMGFEVAEHEVGKTAAQLWLQALRPFYAKLENEGEAAWPEIVDQYDHFCTREFLEANHWSEGAIEMFGLLLNQEALMNSSFVELLREEVGNYYADMVHIDGGMDRLPYAFFPALSRRIRFGARMVAVDQTSEGVTIHYRTGADRMALSADYAILTVPFSIMRHVETLKPFSRAKQRAIRQLHYDASAKVFLQCRRRFWEEDDGIFGGGSVTDLAARNIYYPDHGRDTGRGVLLGSYTWSEDAQRWGSLSPADRVAQAVENVAAVHPQILQEFEVGASKMWHDDEFAGGAFALFDPSQQTLLHHHIAAPEGRIHFAGEHTSLAHAWIQGAIESGLRAAQEVHQFATP